jgi:Thioredoxin
VLLPLLLASFAFAAPLPVCDLPRANAPALPSADSTIEALYASGVDYRAFLASAKARREQWVRHTEQAAVPADALVAARALSGRWRILVAAVDGCSDSVNTIPYLAALAEQVPSLELRIVQPGPGRAVMESHRTPDGRAATPTVVILDASGTDVGCWVERPAKLQAMAIAARAAGTIDAFSRDKQQWYDADAGASTIREVVAVLQAAASGTPRCDAPRPLP